MRLSETKTDEALERDGVWVAIRYGAEVKVARAGNPRAETWRSRLSWEDRRLIDIPDLRKGREERLAELITDAIAETMLLDWRGEVFSDDEGNPITYSVATAKALLNEYDWLRADVYEVANSRETYFRAEVQESGNASPKSSGGKSKTRGS